MIKRYQVKVKDKQPFSMIDMDGVDDALAVCRAIFGNRLEWVR